MDVEGDLPYHVSYSGFLPTLARSASIFYLLRNLHVTVYNSIEAVDQLRFQRSYLFERGLLRSISDFCVNEPPPRDVINGRVVTIKCRALTHWRVTVE